MGEGGEERRAGGMQGGRKRDGRVLCKERGGETGGCFARREEERRAGDLQGETKRDGRVLCKERKREMIGS